MRRLLPGVLLAAFLWLQACAADAPVHSGEARVLERAREAIARHRMGEASMTILDGAGRPLEGATISYQQKTHDFLFGFQDFTPMANGLAWQARDAGFNHFVVCPYWNVIEPAPGMMNWELTDRASPLLLQTMGFSVKVHPGVYLNHWAVPQWMRGKGFAELTSELAEFMRITAERFAGAEFWEISNEANLRYFGDFDFVSRDQMVELIQNAAREIRRANPSARLSVNVWGGLDRLNPRITRSGLERLGHASNGYNLAPFEWFDYLNDRRIDYDVIGLQYRAGRMYIGQVGSQDNPIVDLHLISSYLDAYGTLGKRVHITEFVISDNAGVRGPWKWGQQEQVDYAKGFYTIAFSKPFVDAVVWWNAERFAGFWDGKRPGPVFLALGDLISTEWTTHGSRTTDSAGQVRFTGCAGDYELTISRGDLQKNENIHLDAATVSPLTVVLREATN